MHAPPFSGAVTPRGIQVWGHKAWFLRFIRRLLAGDTAILRLLRTNPFPADPPAQIRETNRRLVAPRTAWRLPPARRARGSQGSLTTIIRRQIHPRGKPGLAAFPLACGLLRHLLHRLGCLLRSAAGTLLGGAAAALAGSTAAALLRSTPGTLLRRSLLACRRLFSRLVSACGGLRPR